MPSWNRRNLTRHYRDHLTKDGPCFWDSKLWGIVLTPLTESRYELRADEAVANAWAEYEGESWDVKNEEYRESRAYFVDDDLIVAITDRDRNDFVTCFHKHFGCTHGMDPKRGASVGQKRLRYKDQLKMDDEGKAILNLRRIRGV